MTTNRGDKLLHPTWGNDSVRRNWLARARFRRRDRGMMLIVALLLAAGVAGQILHHYWPARDCMQIGEYTCVDRYEQCGVAGLSTSCGAVAR